MKIKEKLEKIFEEHKNERICVVGTTCTGKSTLLKNIPYAHDMDEIVFPTLSKKEAEYVCKKPWTEDIGKTMMKFVRERVHIEPGKPVFGTVVIDSDFIVYLKVSDKLLKERSKMRGKNYIDGKNMQAQLEKEIKSSKIPYTEIYINEYE
jgi:hypothetical protein